MDFELEKLGEDTKSQKWGRTGTLALQMSQNDKNMLGVNDNSW